jgi:hypothetical protein
MLICVSNLFSKFFHCINFNECHYCYLLNGFQLYANIGFIPQLFFPIPSNHSQVIMPRVQKRKYEKIDQPEIDLVLRCNDSHEFYELYREEFPTRKKGIDSISKIWKRRGEFLKKQQGTEQPEAVFGGSSQELEQLIAFQNKILSEMSGLMKEQLMVSREILTSLQKPAQKGEEHNHKPTPVKMDEPKESVKKSGHEKPSDIMIGS